MAFNESSQKLSPKQIEILARKIIAIGDPRAFGEDKQKIHKIEILQKGLSTDELAAVTLYIVTNSQSLASQN